MRRLNPVFQIVIILIFTTCYSSYGQVEAVNDIAAIPSNGIISISVIENDNLDDHKIGEVAIEITTAPANGIAVVNGVNIEYHAPIVNSELVESFEYKLISPESEDIGIIQMNVLLPDNIPPVISCPPDVTLYCEPERVCLDGEEYVVPNNTAVHIDTFYTPQGKVPVFGFNPDDPLVNHFAVISSTPAPPADPDLGTPNMAFGGTGVGMGGGPGLYQNDNSLGNVFIITDVAGSEDDQCCGATAFTFDFSLIGSGTVTFQNLNVFDVDDIFQQSGAHLKLYNAANVEIASFTPPVTGDNGRYTVYAIDPNTNDYYTGVAKAVYTLNGSGSLGRICFTSDDLTHSTGFATATDDNALPPTIRYEDQVTTICDDVQLITRLWRAIDCVGNQDTCYQTIYSYNDLVAPDLVCPEDLTLECLDSTDPASTGWAVATDACPADVTLTYADVTSYIDDCTDQIIRMWTAVDFCGNDVTCAQIITITDETGPVMTCPAEDVTLECTEEADPVITGLATATDECGDITITYADVTSEEPCQLLIARTWTAMDGCGNPSTCVQTIRLLDTTPPDLECPSEVTIECTDDPGDLALTGEGTATDACSDVTVTYEDDPAEGNCAGEGTIHRTWTATDECGNNTTCWQIIHITDTQAPDLECPADVTLQCTDDTSPTANGAGIASATDACTDDVTITVTGSLTPGDCPHEYTMVRTWTAVDDCGNSASCEQTVVVVDMNPPVITCPADATVECMVDPTPDVTGMATATDACGDVTVSYTDATVEGNCPAEYTITRSWTAVDECGNQSTCPQTIMVLDTQDPILACADDITIECDESTDPDNTGWSSATDACSDVTVTYTDVTLSNELCVKVIERRWKATDECGNTSECDQLITAVDSEAPDLVCPAEVTIECTDDPFDLALTGEGTATDACSDVTVTYEDDPTNGDCVGEGTIYRTWSATDACGNNTSCWQIIHIVDTQAPDLECPVDVTLQCTDDTSPTVNGAGVATATDACSDVTITVSGSLTPGDCPQEYTMVRTWTAIDDCGNTVTCDQNITVIDPNPPVISCPADATVECTADPTPDVTGMATATDVCGDVTITHTDVTVEGNCPAEYTITRTWTAVDACGNESSCPQVISVLDTQNPDLMCIADITIECDESTDPNNTGWSSATDECGDVTVTYADITLNSEECLQVIERRWHATDACGNTAECDQLITLKDTKAPDLICPANVTIECDVYPLPVNTGVAIATDNCNDLTIDYSDEVIIEECGYTIKRSWTASDACGNQTGGDGSIEFVDQLLTSENDFSGNETYIHFDELNPGIFDGSTYMNLGITFSSPLGLIVAGNFGSFPSSLPNVIANISQGSIPIQMDFSTPIHRIGFYLGSNNDDNVELTATCMMEGSVVGVETFLTNSLSQFFGIEAAEPFDQVILIVEDVQANGLITVDDVRFEGGNSCIQMIRMLDTKSPDFVICPEDISIECTESTDPSDTGMAAATDNCTDDVTITVNDVTAEGDCPVSMVIERTWTAKDICNNTSTCTQIIELLDVLPPVIICPGDTMVECGFDLAPDVFGEVIAIDDCGDVTLTYADVTTSGWCLSAYTLHRTWTAVDACDNSSSCTQTVMVQDTTYPVFTSGCDSLFLECDENTDPEFTGYPTATDNCGDASVYSHFDKLFPGDCPGEMVIKRTWTVVDECQNYSTCHQYIIVEDTQAPEVTAPEDLTLECTEDTDVQFVGTATATDNCSENVEISYEDTTVEGDCPNEYMLIRKWIAVDECGNSCEDANSPYVSDAGFESGSLSPYWSSIGLASANAGDGSITPEQGNYQGRISSGESNGDAALPGAVENFLGLPAGTLAGLAPGTPTEGSAMKQIITAEAGQEITFRYNFATNELDEADIFNDYAFVTIVDNGVVILATKLTGTFVPAPGTNFDGQTGYQTYSFTFPSSGTCVFGFGVMDVQDKVVESALFIDEIISGCAIQKISILDTQAPDLACPLDLTIECVDLANADLGVATATDACGDVTLNYVDVTVAGDCDSQYTIERTYSAVDACGNDTTCLQTIQIVDTTPPGLTCPDDMTVNCTASVSPDDIGLATATDLCSDVTVSYTDVTMEGDCPNEYTITRTWIATDACENMSDCVQTITVIDTMPPTISCPPDVTIECDDETSPLTNAALGYAMATDACGLPDVTFEDVTVAGDCVNEYAIERTYTATDACGNTSECTQTIYVQDNTDPVIYCPANIAVSCDASVDPMDIGSMATATDNCTELVDITFEDTDISGDCPVMKMIQRDWIATDECGNTATCMQMLYIYDSEGPSIICPDDITSNTDKFYCSKMELDIGFPTYTDNCEEDVTISWSRSDDLSIEDPYPIGMTTIEWIVTGLCSGKSDTCTQKITIVDGQIPTVICNKVDVALNNDLGQVEVPIDALYDGVFDNCTGEEYLLGTITVSQTQFDCSDYPEVLVEVCATDEAGNVGCCFTKVKIQDNYAPNAVCQDITIDANGNDVVTILPDDVDGGSTDNADDCLLTFEVFPTEFESNGNHDVTLTVTDIAGNQSTCASTVTIFGIPVSANDVQITAKVWIQGSMNQTQTAMVPWINDLLPLNQPYGMAPFNYMGEEYVSQMPEDAIDWVLVRLRDEQDPTMILRQRAGLLMSDGYIVDLDASSPITFENLGDGTYYLEVVHRNHVAVISDNAIEVIAGLGLHDFTAGAAMGTAPMKIMPNGAYALWCGDLNADGTIDASDRSIAWNARNQVGYLQTDGTMDGMVDAEERSVTWNNRNKSSGVPQ